MIDVTKQVIDYRVILQTSGLDSVFLKGCNNFMIACICNRRASDQCPASTDAYVQTTNPPP